MSKGMLTFKPLGFAALCSVPLAVACGGAESAPAPNVVVVEQGSDTAAYATRHIRVDASAQSYGGELRVYARLYVQSFGSLTLGEGDALTATALGATRPLAVNEHGDYTASFPMTNDATDVTIAFARPANRASATLAVHVPAAFQLVSSPEMVRADAPVVFRVDAPPSGAKATVRLQGPCLPSPFGESIVLAARSAPDGTITLDPSAFDFYRSGEHPTACNATVGVRFESYSEPSVGFAYAAALGLQERDYVAAVEIPKS